MNNICRLCLSVTSQITCEMSEESEISQKLQTCLSIKIPVNDQLPNQVCRKCSEKVDEIQDFITKIRENQITLHHHFNEGIEALHAFYLNLRVRDNMIVIKEDKTEIDLLDNKENDNLNVALEAEQIDIKPKNTIEREETYHYSSEDDVTLSSIKLAKEEPSSTKVEMKKTETSKTDLNIGPLETQLKNNYSTFYENSFVTTKEKHMCLTCFQSFDTQNELLNHYNTEHGAQKIAENKNSVEFDAYTKMTSVDGNLVFKCNKCEKICRNEKGIKSHKAIHSELRPFVCKMCGRTYNTASEIIRHGRAHNGVKLDCSYHCGYSTVYLGALKEHEKRHSNDFKYKCEKCDKTFQVKTWYIEHQNIHNGVRPFVCNICGLAFHMNRYLTAHRSNVHPQSSSVKRYICVHCSLPCDSRNALTEHLKEHGIKTSFLCDMCGKTLSNAEQLKFHKRMHLGDKPYTCSTCNKSFTKKFNLKIHERTHSGEKAYFCGKCGKGYTQRSTLLRHINKHHTESSEKCTKCQKSFADRSLLESHEKICL